MERPGKRDRTGDRIEAPEPSQTGCPSCNSADPQARARHQLHLARMNQDGMTLTPERGLSHLRQHLQVEFAQQQGAEDRKRLIDDICQWVAQQVKLYSDFVHPETGAKLFWWDARRYCHEGTQHQQPDKDHLDAAWHTNQRSGRLPAAETQRMIVDLLQTVAADPWAQGHIVLMEAGLGRPSTHAETAEACRQFATRWPQDAEGWLREADWWATGAQGPCLLTRQPGEEG